MKRKDFITRADIGRGGRKLGVGDKLPPLTPDVLRVLGEWKGAGEYVMLPVDEGVEVIVDRLVEDTYEQAETKPIRKV